jgi:hypothetical protein
VLFHNAPLPRSPFVDYVCSFHNAPLPAFTLALHQSLLLDHKYAPLRVHTPTDITTTHSTLRKQTYIHTDNRPAIERWIHEHGTSPLSRLPLAITDLRPNRALREMVENHLHLNNTPPSGDSSGEAETTDGAAWQVVTTPLELHAESLADGGAAVVITPPAVATSAGDELPADLVLVLDVSGSMQSMVTLKTAGGVEECNGLDRLAIVKHAALTIVENLVRSATVLLRRSFSSLSIQQACSSYAIKATPLSVSPSDSDRATAWPW